MICIVRASKPPLCQHWEHTLRSTRRGFWSLRRAVLVRTLDTSRLSNKDFLVPSGLVNQALRVLAAPEIRGSYVSYGYQGTTRSPFPLGTQGFLYWNLDADAPALAGQVRFRITTSSDPATFPEGQDLQLPDGSTWNIPIFRIPRKICYAAFRAQLLSDKLVTEGLLDTAVSVSGSNGRRIERPSAGSLFVWKFGQTFPVVLESASIRPWILGRAGGQRLRLEYVFSLKEPTGTTRIHHALFVGKALVHFERSTLPEHKGTRTVVLRIAKIVQLTKSENASGVDGVPEPKEGSLVMMRESYGAWVPWSVNVDQPRSEYHMHASKALAILFDNEERQAGLA